MQRAEGNPQMRPAAIQFLGPVGVPTVKSGRLVEQSRLRLGLDGASRQPCVGGADAPSLGGKVGQGSGYMKSPHTPRTFHIPSTVQASINHMAQSLVVDGLEIFRTARRADASRACWGGVSRASEGRSTVGSGKTISGSADFSVGQILTREHAPHPNPVSLVKAVSPLLGESAVVSGRGGEAKDVTQTVVCVTRQGSESLAGLDNRELRSSRRGSSDPGRS